MSSTTGPTLSRRAFALGVGSAGLAMPVHAQQALRAAYQGCGLDMLARDPSLVGHGKAFALLTHAGAVDARGRRSVDVVKGLLGDRLVALLSPEHGLAGKAAAGEVVGDSRDAASGLPVTSLYGARKEPPAELLARIDTLIIDLQDVGLRPFTYAPTMVDAMRAASAAGVRVLVLDRPNPLGGLAVDGPRPEPGFTSPVSALPLPFRHGLTIGETAQFMFRHLRLEGDLQVVHNQSWQRANGIGIWRDKPPRPFAAPSPNLRSPQAVLAYAASVLIEGTNLSEGRGTARPFETIGAPWCRGEKLAKAMTALALPGVRFASLSFTPTASKHAGKRCGGVQFEVLDEERYDPLLTGLSLIAAAHRLHDGHFAFLPGERPFFDLLIGNAWVRSKLLAGDPPARIIKRWQGDVEAFKAERKDFLLY
jgi:uncharacterized protein YbbC (DUF1343 family)